MLAFADAPDVDAQDLRDPLSRGPLADGLQNHLVLLDRCEAVDLPVIGKAFVVRGQQAERFRRAQLL
ncbi:hypothetical protein D9M68_854310 [compost metagenome]